MENTLKKALSLFLAYPFLVMAHMEEHHVTAGQATFEAPDAQTQVIRAADKTAINCKSFNVRKNETVQFVQPHQKASVLCRVTGKEASIIEGRLEANGRLFLINPQSIFFRETAQVNVHSLIASTLNIKDEDFVKGNYRFFLDPSAKDSAVVNWGQITAEQDVIFLAPHIINHSVVKATLGRVALLGAELITLNFEGDNLISFALDGSLKSGFIEQAGNLVGGKEAFIKLRIADEAIKSVVNRNGFVEATALKFENGKIRLVAGSSIAAPIVKVEGPNVQTAGDFIGVTKLDITAEKDLCWHGGYIYGKQGSTDVSLSALTGILAIDAPIGFPNPKNKDDKVALKTLALNGKLIDQNAAIKSMGRVVYSADKILLGGDIYAVNSPITFNGPVFVKSDNVKIASGRIKGDITFNGPLDADQPNRHLTIFNGSGSVAIKGPIGTLEPLGLSIETEKLSLPNIGDKNHAGAPSLTIKASSVDLLGNVVHAGEQMWDASSIQLKSGTLTTFITDENPMIFTPNTKIVLEPQTNVIFETRGSALDLSNLSGDHQQSVTINTGLGEAKIGGFIGKLGPVQVQGRDVKFTGKIEAGNVFMEAQDSISYNTKSGQETYRTAINSEGEVTLNAKRGMIGTKELPILIHSKGKIYVGSKSFAYIEGTCEGGFPSVYPKNPPPRIVFNGIEIQYLFSESIFKEQPKLKSLKADLNHPIPEGFVNIEHFSPRQAKISYLDK